MHLQELKSKSPADLLKYAEELEIENAILNTDNQQIKFTGKVDDIFSNPNANINFKLNSYNLVEFENFLKLNINKNGILFLEKELVSEILEYKFFIPLL